MLHVISRMAFAGAVFVASTLSSMAADKVSIAAISGYFAQGFGVSIVNGLNRAKTEFGIDLKLVDTGNRALDYEEQFSNLAKSHQYNLIFVMGWELTYALQKASAASPDHPFTFLS